MKSFPKLVLSASLLAGSAMSMVGCETPPEPTPRPRSYVPAVPVTWQSQTARLDKITPTLLEEIDTLPGIDGTDHRKIAAAVLKDLALFLAAADGPVQSPGFANRLSVMTDAAKTMANPSIPRGRMIAVENQALHVAVLALADIASRPLFDDPDLAKLVDAAKVKINAVDGIDQTNGPLHDLVATDAFQSLKPALVVVNQDLQDRFGEGSVPVETPVAPPVEPTPAPKAPTTTPTPPPVPAPADPTDEKPKAKPPADEMGEKPATPAPTPADDTKKSLQEAADKAKAQLDSMTPKPGDSDEVLKQKLQKLNDFNNATTKPGT